MFPQVEKQEVGGWRRRRRVMTQGYGFITEHGHCCPTGLPASNTRHKPNGSERKDPSVAQLSNVPVESRMEELTTRLAIQAEENEMLKAALGSALRGKEEDFRMYHETLGQVKGVFLQALRQQKADKH